MYNICIETVYSLFYLPVKYSISKGCIWTELFVAISIYILEVV